MRRGHLVQCTVCLSVLGTGYGCSREPKPLAALSTPRTEQAGSIETAVAAPTFFCSFETSATDCGFLEQAKEPGRATVVPIARDGRFSVKLETEPHDTDVAGSGGAERNDLVLPFELTGCVEGEEQWWAHSVQFPPDYTPPDEWAVVFDFHNTRPGGGQANFQINVWPERTGEPKLPARLEFQIAHGVQAQPTIERAPVGSLVRERWYDFVYHVRWSSNGTGFFIAWVNGVQKMDYSGATLYPEQGCYLKLANYHTASGNRSAVLHDRVVRGTGADVVSSGPLEFVAR